MSDNDFKKLDQFLKKNAASPPAAPLGEKERIWRAIEEEAAAGSAPWWRKFSLRLPDLRIALPVAAACAITITVLVGQQQKKNAETDRILAVALAYQLEELSEEPGLF